MQEEYRKFTLPVAVSIILSGQYEDDVDNSEVVYAGQGGNGLLGNKCRIKYQVMCRGNLVLKVCNMEIWFILLIYLFIHVIFIWLHGFFLFNLVGFVLQTLKQKILCPKGKVILNRFILVQVLLSTCMNSKTLSSWMFACGIFL